MQTSSSTVNKAHCTTSSTDNGRSSDTLTGRVLSFHSRKGYGKVLGSDNQHYFVHHTHLKPQQEPIRSDWHSVLYTGEYCEFIPTTTKRGLVATQVTGIDGGPLMCDHAAWKIVQYRNKNPRRSDSRATAKVPPSQQKRILTSVNRPVSQEQQSFTFESQNESPMSTASFDSQP